MNKKTKEKIKNILKRIPYIRDSVLRHDNSFYYQLEKIIMKKGEIFFIQIGACDGIIADPIYSFMMSHNCSGILVEPIAYLFERLKKNYAGKTGLVFENAAISDKDEIRDFYCVSTSFKETGFRKAYWEGLGSLVRRPDLPGIEKYIRIEKVKCLSYASLIKKHNVKELDLLVIDTEGYEYEILKQVPLVGIKPKVIFYEYKCLEAKVQESCRHLLEKEGYAVKKFYNSGDSFCILR